MSTTIENVSLPVVAPSYWSASCPVDGLTAYGIFEDDEVFSDTFPQLATSITSMLGSPIVSVELSNQQIAVNFEVASMKFISLVNSHNIQENLLGYMGMTTGSSFSQQLIRSTPIPYIVELAADYGTEAQSGGTVDLKRGVIDITQSVQDYDLQSLWANVSESGNRMEIRRIFHERTPAMTRFLDPFAGNGMDLSAMLGTMGFSGFAVASNFLVMPIYETLLRAQSIELNDEVRRAAFSFQVHNNKIRLFPVPEEDGHRMWFEYYVTNDKFGNSTTESGSDARIQSGLVSDYSNVPFSFVPLSDINDVGKQWIYEYTLALCKITLGNVRRKYAQMPIPNSTVQLDGEILRQEGANRIDALEKSLNDALLASGKAAQMEKAAQNEDNVYEVLKHIPLPIYVF